MTTKTTPIEVKPPTDDYLRGVWRAMGGSFHGPITETGTMPESKLLPFLRSLWTERLERQTSNADDVVFRAAHIVLTATIIREDSYDHAAADAATARDQKERVAWEQAHPKLVYPSCIDYSRFYKLDLQEACELAAKQHGCQDLGFLVYLALSSWWNDTTEWAVRILGVETAKTQYRWKTREERNAEFNKMLDDAEAEAKVSKR
jgi:hypothetical protein